MQLKPLVDGDILLYEIGFGAETGWRAITGSEDIPPFWYVEEMLLERLAHIQNVVGTNEPPQLFITEGRTFRYDIAKTKPYKGTRTSKKPWHFNNLSVYLKGVLNAEVCTTIEADDRMAIEHTASRGKTIICSRDKDLKQVPGWFMAWELGAQPQFGPIEICQDGNLSYNADKNKLTGTGYSWFCAQTLMGDTTDNIPGLSGCGDKKANELLSDFNDPMEAVEIAYAQKYGEEEGAKHLLEQAQLCWIVRRLKGDGSPEVWHPGLKS